jgi:integrase
LYILGEHGLVAQWSERSAHNRLVAGSIPAEPRTVDVLTEEFTIREMLEVLMGQEGKRKLRLRRKTNDELFALYDSQLVLKHRSADGLKEARRVLGHYRDYLGQYPPTPELAASFLAQFADLKATTLYRYHSIVQGFQSWYGDKLDTKIKVPETLPDYIEEGDLKKLKAAMATKKTHKGLIPRNLLLIELGCKTGLRRAELANLKSGDIDLTRQCLVVRLGKGQKDRVVDLAPSLIEPLRVYLKDKSPQESVFGLSAETISGLIHWAAARAGVDIHAHSMRDVFATRLIDNGVDVEVLRRLLGHSSLNNTRRYLARTDAQRRAAIMSLDRPAPLEEQRNLRPDRPGGISIQDEEGVDAGESGGQPCLGHGEGRNGTRHETQLRNMSRELAAAISVPSFTDKELWRQLPLAEPGRFYLRVGAAEVTHHGEIKVEYPLPSVGTQSHLQRSFEEHLQSCGEERFFRLLGGGGSVSNWCSEVGRYCGAVLSLLAEVVLGSDSRLELSQDGSVQPGATKWFSITAWHDLLVRAGGNTWISETWYLPPERVGDLWVFKCGAFDIARASAPGGLREYRDFHVSLRSDPELVKIAKGLYGEEGRLKDAAAQLSGLLEEFSDFERLPGRCGLCRR